MPCAWANGRARRLQPLSSGSHGVSARLTFAFEHPRRLLPGRRRLSACIEPGMGQRAGIGEDRHDGAKKPIAGRRRAHRARSDQAQWRDV